MAKTKKSMTLVCVHLKLNETRRVLTDAEWAELVETGEFDSNYDEKNERPPKLALCAACARQIDTKQLDFCSILAE